MCKLVNGDVGDWGKLLYVVVIVWVLDMVFFWDEENGGYMED